MVITDVRDGPILMNGQMVRAVLDGRKTQTRRVIVPQPIEPLFCKQNGLLLSKDPMAVTIKCPYGKPGDRLWVRETFTSWFEAWAETHIRYKADNHHKEYINGLEIKEKFGIEPKRISYKKWTPSIHMPRWASRINLEITDIRVERVQDIKLKDAIAEGIQIKDDLVKLDPFQILGDFANLWDSINAKRKDKKGNLLKYSWADNPWVWVVEFKVL